MTENEQQASEATAAPKIPDTTPLPQVLAEKYKAKGWTTYEQVEQGYSSLEGQRTAQPPAPAQGEAPAPTPGQPQIPVTDHKAELGQLLSDVQARAMAEGKISDDDRRALVDRGFTEEVIAGVEQGYQSRGREYLRYTLDQFGGEQGYKDTMAWAATSLDDATKSRLNDAFGSGNPDLVAAAANELKTRRAGATLSEGTRAAGDTAVQPFASLAEQNAAFQDKRYKADPTYKAQVQARCKASRF